MSEWIKELLAAIGGGAVVVIALLAILKSSLTKLVDKTIETSFEKSTIKLTNKLERTTKAYDILLKKEFDYYEKFDSYKSAIVPLIQDLEYWCMEAQKGDLETAKEQYREHWREYLEILPAIKADSLLYEHYIPENIFHAVASLIMNMQSDLEYLGLVSKVLYKKTDGDIDDKRLKEIANKVLQSISQVELLIRTRLKELSSN